MLSTIAQFGGLGAAIGLLLAIVTVARRAHTPDACRRGWRWCGVGSAALLFAGVTVAIIGLWLERRGLAWSDLAPLDVNRAGTLDSDAARASLLRRLRADLVSETDARRALEALRDDASRLAPELVLRLKRLAWSEADVLRWMRLELPERVRVTTDASDPARLLIAFDLAGLSEHLDAPPIDFGWLEAECVAATLDDVRLKVASPFAGQSPRREAALDQAWSAVREKQATEGAATLTIDWRFTLRRQPSGELETISHVERARLKHASVEVRAATSLTALGESGTWEVAP